MKSYFKIILFNFVGVLVLFSLLEICIGLLIADIKLAGTSKELLVDSVFQSSPGLRKNYSGESSGMKKKTNNFGGWLYTTEIDTQKAIELYLGDSVTMGIGVDNDSTFAGRISNNINILNLSLIGYSIKDYKNILQTVFANRLLKNKIHKVRIFWTLNDIYHFSTIRLTPAIEKDNVFYSVIDFLRKNSKAYIYLKNVVSDRAKVYYEYDSQYYNRENEYYKKSIKTIEDISILCDKLKVELVFYLLPYEYQLRMGYNRTNYPQQLLLEDLMKFNDKVIDLGYKLNDYSDSSKLLYLYGDGIHLSNFGHKVISEIL